MSQLRLTSDLVTVSRLFSLVTFTLGVVVLFGWYSNNQALIQVNEVFVPMQYNTALGFVILGASGWCLGARQRLPALVSGYFLLLLGFLTLVQYTFSVDLAIDQLLMEHYIDVNTSHPGRMAPNTALCFALAGIAWLVAISHNKYSNALLSIIASCIFSLGVVAFTGYIAGIETAYGWGALTKMAVHTSIGFMASAIAIFIYCYHEQQRKNYASFYEHWLTIPVAIFGLSLTFTTWHAIYRYHQEIEQKYNMSSGLAAEGILIFGIFATLSIIFILNARNNKAQLSASRSRVNMPAVVIILGVVLSMSIYQLLSTNLKTQTRLKFEHRVNQHGKTFEQGLRLYVEMLRYVRNTYYVDNELSRTAFKNITLAEINKFKGMLAIEWLPLVKHEDRQAFEAQQSQTLGIDYQLVSYNDAGELVPAPEQPYYFPVSYIQPVKDNEKAYGINPLLSTTPDSREAILAAIANNTVSISRRIDLVQTPKNGFGVLIVLPVYDQVKLSQGMSYKDAVAGLVSGVIYLQPTFERIIDNFLEPAGLNITFTDRGAIEDEQYLYFHRSRVAENNPGIKDLTKVYPIKIADRMWEMHAQGATYKIYPARSATNFIPPLTILIISITLAVLIRLVERRIKERNLLLDRISERESHFKALVNTIPGMAYTCNYNNGWRMSFVSKEVKSLTGYDIEHFTQNGSVRWSQFIHPDDLDRVNETIKQATQQHQSFTIEYRMIDKDGNTHWVYEQGQATYDEAGTPQQIHGSVLDITDGKVNEQKFKGLLESAPDSLILVDKTGTIAFVNKQVENVLGYQADELVGETIDVLLPHDLRATHPSLLSAYFDKPKVRGMGVGRDLTAIKKNGQPVAVEISLSPIQTEEGTLVLAAIRDITARKALEIELIQAKDKAESATQAKSDFLANMSHEIRTPMNAIIGMSQLALNTKLNPKQANYIDKVNRSAESLLGIINDILDFSKIEAGKFDIEHIEFRLEDVFDNLANLVGLKAEEKNLELMFDIPDSVPTSLIGDPLRIGQILINLGNNAVKFTDSGEVVIRVELQEQTNDKVILAFHVRDTGVGIPQSHQAKLFQSFSQVDTSTTRKFGGTGLGLAISKRLTEMMGGSIWCQSEEGVGSQFSFTVSVGLTDKAWVEKEKHLLDNLKVLVVDDNATSREILTTILSNFDLQVDQANHGEQALEMLKEQDKAESYNLVIMDWKMPKIDGIEATKRIQSDETLENIPTVIMVTAYGREKAYQAAKDVVISGFLTKPVTPSSLLDSIMDALGKKVIEVSRSTARQEHIQQTINQLRGAKILLVEDNEINMELAVELLTSNGLVVATAENGAIAIEMLERESFDGVLMDCQMPVLDGYEATKIIRQDDRFAQLPILAMTANAMVGDKEKVLAVGMNAHIAKPINTNELFLSLAKWVTPSTPQLANEHNNATASIDPDNIEIPSIIGINDKLGLSTCQGNKHLYKKLLLKFTERELDFEDKFKQALYSDDAQAPIRVAHTLKGVAANIGASAIQTLALNLETACKSHHEISQLQPYLVALTSELTATIEAIKQAFDHDTEVTQSLVNDSKEQVQAFLTKLTELLEEFDTDALEAFEVLSNQQRLVEQSTQLSQIRKAIEDYNFEEALLIAREVETWLTHR